MMLQGERKETKVLSGCSRTNCHFTRDRIKFIACWKCFGHSSKGNTFVQSDTVIDGTRMLFYLYRSLQFLLSSSHCWHPRCKILPPSQKSQHTRLFQVSGMSYVWWQGSTIWNSRKSVGMNVFFLGQVLSVRPILSAQVRWSFATAYCQFLHIPTYELSTPPCRVPRESVECSWALARYGALQCSPT